jgi:hypothetical protein
VALSALIGLCGSGRAGQTPAEKSETILWQDTFEADAGTWSALGPNGKASVTTDAALVKNGKGALAFAYVVGGKKEAGKDSAVPIDVLYRPTPNGELAKMRSLRFWIRGDEDTPVAVTLSEKEGGRYMTLFWLPKNVWQQVTLAPGDFWLTDDKNDPKDPDNRLDLDQVDSVSLISLWSFLGLGAADNPGAAALIGSHTGAHTLWLDDVTASSEPPPAAPPVASESKGVWVDDLGRPVLTWMPLGDMQLRLDTSDAPVKGHALRADYTQNEGKFNALIHDLRRVNLANADQLSFEAASVRDVKLVLSLEEKGGARYTSLVDVPAGSKATRFSIPFRDFSLADDSPPDSDGQLDLNQLKTLTIVDISGLINKGQEKNTLWLGPIRARAPEK